MPRSKPIPQQVLHAAESGEPEALRRLGALLDPGNATASIVGLLFKHLTAQSAPELPAPRPGRQFAPSATVAARPSACLCALWKLTSSRKRLKLDVQHTLDLRLLESIDSALRWTRLCLHGGWPCVSVESLTATGAATLRIRQYLALAEVLVKLLELEGDRALALYSSRPFIDLFIELWLAGERSNGVDGPQLRRLVDTSSPEGCNFITLADAILSNNASREMFLSRCTKQTLCRQFALASTDRASDQWEGESVILSNWINSLTKLVAVTARLYESSALLCECLTTIGYLPELTAQVAALVETIHVDPELHELDVLIDPILIQLAQLFVKKDLPFANREIWSQLHAGFYIESLFRATVLASGEDLQILLRILNHMGDYTVYPRVLGGLERELEGISLGELEHRPNAVAQWTAFLAAYNRAVDAVKALKHRPSVYFCDYMPCALSGQEQKVSSKQCSKCHSVVYCSRECQMRDWEGQHRNECKHARQIYSTRTTSHSWYDNKTRASQAIILEMFSQERSEVEKAQTTDHAAYRVLDCISLVSRQPEDSYLEVIADGEYWDDTFRQTYLQPRFESLMNAYQHGSIPQDWLLIEGVFAPIGDEHAIYLTVLLKPVREGYRAVYCVPRYRHFC